MSRPPLRALLVCEDQRPRHQVVEALVGAPVLTRAAAQGAGRIGWAAAWTATRAGATTPFTPPWADPMPERLAGPAPLLAEVELALAPVPADDPRAWMEATLAAAAACDVVVLLLFAAQPLTQRERDLFAAVARAAGRPVLVLVAGREALQATPEELQGMDLRFRRFAARLAPGTPVLYLPLSPAAVLRELRVRAATPPPPPAASAFAATPAPAPAPVAAAPGAAPAAGCAPAAAPDAPPPWETTPARLHVDPGAWRECGACGAWHVDDPCPSCGSRRSSAAPGPGVPPVRVGVWLRARPPHLARLVCARVAWLATDAPLRTAVEHALAQAAALGEPPAVAERRVAERVRARLSAALPAESALHLDLRVQLTREPE